MQPPVQEHSTFYRDPGRVPDTVRPFGSQYSAPTLRGVLHGRNPDGWVSTSYLLASAVFLVPFGRIADIYGRKRYLPPGSRYLPRLVPG